jgi:phospholipid/cholesterol/gamma-HCH transport system substrate-binding protein
MVTRRAFAGHALVVLGFVLTFAALFVYILYQAGAITLFERSYDVTATVPTANFLAPGARVTAAGAEVGRVTSVSRAGPLSPNATVELQLTNSRVFPLPSDSEIQVRTRSQVGENYVNIVVGRANTTIPDHGSIGLDDAAPFVSTDQVLNIIHGRTQQQARTLLQQLGTDLLGRGQQLNETLGQTSTFVVQGTQMLDTLMPQRRQLGQLVDQLGRLTSAIGERTQAIEVTARQGTATLQTLASRETELSSVLRDLPDLIASVKSTSSVIGTVSDRATPVVENLATATAQLRPAIAALAPAARDGRTIVTSLRTAIPSLDALLGAAPSAIGYPGAGTRGLLSDLTPIRSTFCQLNPALGYLKPYTADFWSIIPHLGSTSNPYDATGHIVRLVPIINENSLSGAPPAIEQAAHELLASGLFVPDKVISINPYPKPGAVGSDVAHIGDPYTPAQFDKTYTYPRVQAAC